MPPLKPSPNPCNAVRQAPWQGAAPLCTGAESMGWPAIDWQPLWIAPLASLGHRVQAWLETYPQRPCTVVSKGHVAEALNTLGIQAGPHGIDGQISCVRFVPQAALPLGEPYETFIARTLTVPTRDNLHDLLNGLVWLCLPHTKRRLNQMQAASIAAHGVRPRGPLRDAMTLLDENGALLYCDDALWAALRAHDWHTALVQRREDWLNGRVQIVIMGHALLEKLQQPRSAHCAHVLRVAEPWQSLQDLDRQITHSTVSPLSSSTLVYKPFQPLPVLGVPGWWPANQDPGFYNDATVFRPARLRASPPALA